MRDWVLQFSAVGPVGLNDQKAPGQPPRLINAHRNTPATAIAARPVAAADGVLHW
ncbi:hypothetical protein G3576_30780 [Roseomonas stagni]|uniref:Uncharacterized protein n=1 Tax=Falsiroseomonas algicola TaxID=2716930 RepID=A0A6M1LWQ8_9PROT|nr:hypothetical protein [Falsiroseomonas algicola]NGM24402.1 hypothetical protein [Falsiroseomonas algicola]